MFEKLNAETLEIIHDYLIARVEWYKSKGEEVDPHVFEDLGRVAYQQYKKEEGQDGKPEVMGGW